LEIGVSAFGDDPVDVNNSELLFDDGREGLEAFG